MLTVTTSIVAENARGASWLMRGGGGTGAAGVLGVPAARSAGTVPPAKIADKLAALSEAGRVSVSYEFFPPKTEDGVRNLLTDLERCRGALRPTFVSLTHRSAAAHNEDNWLGIGTQIQHNVGIDVLLHLTCHKTKSGTLARRECCLARRNHGSPPAPPRPRTVRTPLSPFAM